MMGGYYVPLTLFGGFKDVTAAGTAEPLVATKTMVVSVIVYAKPANTGSIYVGPSDVDSADTDKTYAILAAGEDQERTSVPGTIFDLSKVYIDSSVNGEGVTFEYWVA